MSNIKVTQEQVDGFIKTTEVMTIGEKTTLVHATLQNGFTITKTSACVDPENYDENIGAEICLEHIKNEVWYLLGFLLQQREYEKSKPQNQAIGFINDEWKRNRSFPTASNWLKQGAKVARKEWKEMETYIYYDEKTGKAIYTNDLTETEWFPTSSDILENDWEIYEEE